MSGASQVGLMSTSKTTKSCEGQFDVPSRSAALLRDLHGTHRARTGLGMAVGSAVSAQTLR